MRQRKLNTAHLSEQITTILLEDGLSPEELAEKAGIAKSTIYSVLQAERSTTQVAIGRKIAEGSNRDFLIDKDGKIFFEAKPSPDTLTAEKELPPSLEEKLFAGLPVGMQKQLIEISKAFFDIKRTIDDRG